MMANQEQQQVKKKMKERVENEEQQREKKKIDHFSHKHPLTLIEIEEDEKESESSNRSFLRCYGCTDKIKSGVLYYRCEEGCPLFCLHHACAHLPTTIKLWHSLESCVGELHLKERLHQNHESCPFCSKHWFRFAYVCSVCTVGVDMRCATRRPNEAKHAFHQHPVVPWCCPEEADVDLLCSVCSLGVRARPEWRFITSEYFYYRCNYCNFIVHATCTQVSLFFKSPSHRHPLYLDFDYPGSKVCKICQEEIDRSTQWAYRCVRCSENGSDFYIHAAANDDCLTSTIRKGDIQHFDHDHPLALVAEKEDPLHDDHSISQDCHCCKQSISSVPYYTCKHCKSYHLHKLCGQLSMEFVHPLHPNCNLKLLTGLNVSCSLCLQKINGFTYRCSPCDFDIDIECALRTIKNDEIFHEHPLFKSHTKGPFRCHACDRDTEDSSWQCTSCKFWVHMKCASLPMVKDKSSHEHEHDLELIFSIPEKYSRVVVYCRICMKALRDHRWAYHCNLCRYMTHVHDCSNPHGDDVEVTINASDVIHLPFAGEPIVEEKLTNGKMTKHHRHPMILFADEIDSNAIDFIPCFTNLIRGSATWPTVQVDGKEYSGFTFNFHDSILTMQVTGVDLPRYVKHEAHPHVLESTFLNSSTWCHACEQFFFGRGFKCTTCAFTIDPYCALLPRIIKHRYDEHGFSLTYFAIEGIEEYVCEICEEDVIPKYFYHCELCDQSIHARCIWQAYIGFQPSYIWCSSWDVYLVPPNVDLPKCIICDQKETFGHGFAFRGNDFMVHLTCISEDEILTC